VVYKKVQEVEGVREMGGEARMGGAKEEGES